MKYLIFYLRLFKYELIVHANDLVIKVFLTEK